MCLHNTLHVSGQEQRAVFAESVTVNGECKRDSLRTVAMIDDVESVEGMQSDVIVTPKLVCVIRSARSSRSRIS